jgi:serine/threonine-protein kinase
MVSAPHTTSAEELNTFWRAVGVAGINAALIWGLYLALEPFVRRRWPHSMISWTRYTTKGIHDPLVGRDLLFGAAVGAFWALLTWLGVVLHGSAGEPMFVSVETLNGFRAVAGLLLSTVSNSLFSCLFFFFLFFVLRVVLRKEWLAIGAFLLLIGLVFSDSATHWVDRPINLLIGLTLAVALVRLGLLAVIVGFTLHDILINVPFTFDTSAWYFGLTLLAFVVVLLVVIYGFRTSLAGRPLFKEDWL